MAEPGQPDHLVPLASSESPLGREHLFPLPPHSLKVSHPCAQPGGSPEGARERPPPHPTRAQAEAQWKTQLCWFQSPGLRREVRLRASPTSRQGCRAIGPGAGKGSRLL